MEKKISISLNYIFYTTIKQGASATDSNNGQHAVQTSQHAKYGMQKKKINDAFRERKRKRVHKRAIIITR